MSGRLLGALIAFASLLTAAHATPRLVAIEEAPALVGWTEFCTVCRPSAPSTPQSRTPLI